MKRFTLAAMLGLVVGCGPNVGRNFGVAEPHTRIKFHRTALGGYGADIFNDKDVDVVVKDAGYDPAARTFRIGELTVRDNASDVRAANIAQLVEVAKLYPLFTALQAQYGQNAVAISDSVFGGLSGLVSAANPLLTNLAQIKASNPGLAAELARAIGASLAVQFPAVASPAQPPAGSQPAAAAPADGLLIPQ